MGDKKKLQVTITGNARSLQDASKKANKSLGSVDKAAIKMGGALAGAFGAGILIQGIGRAIGKIAEFESTMRRVAIISKGSEKELSKLAKTLGSTTVFTATEAGKAMTFMAQAGFSAQQILKATPGVLQLAAAAQLDLARAADIATNVLSAYGLEAGEINRINDILVTTTNNANTNVEQFAEAFKVVGPLAKAAGVEINELAGLIGVMGDAGLQGSLAGTALRGAINRLIRPSDSAQKVLDRLNVTTRDANGEFRGLTAIFKDLGKANLDATDALEIFERQAATGALVMAAGADKAAFLAEQTKEVGVAANQEQKQLDTLSGDIKKLTSAWDGAILQGTGLIDVFRDLTQSTTAWVQILSGQSGAISSVGVLKAELSSLKSEAENQSIWGLIFDGTQERAQEIRFLTSQIKILEEETGKLAVSADFNTDFYNKFFGTRSADKDIEDLKTLDPLLQRLLGIEDKIKPPVDDAEEAFNAQNEALKILESRARAAAVQLALLKIANEAFDTKTSGQSAPGTVSATGQAEEDNPFDPSDLFREGTERMVEAQIERNAAMAAGMTALAALEITLAEETNKKKLAILGAGLAVASSFISVLSAIQQKAMAKELEAAGDNEEKRLEIRKKFAEKQKRVSIIQALINIAQGITMAFASLPPPASFIAAAITAAAGAAQVAAIASQSFATGGIVAGSSFSGDHVPIMVNSGEMVLNRSQQKSLLNGGSGGSVVVNVNGFVGNEFELAQQIETVLRNQSSNVARATF